MKTLIVNNLVLGTSTNTEATPLFIAMKNSVDTGAIISLSFKDVAYVSSSFLNSSIGEFIDVYGFDFFKNNVKFANCNSDLATLIKGYVTKYKSLVN